MTTPVPYFSKQVFLNPAGTLKRIVIQTASPLLLAQGEGYDDYLASGGATQAFRLPDDADLEVYADDLWLYGSIRLPGRNVTLVARTLRWHPHGWGVPHIDVSGTDGPPPAEPYGLPAGQPPRDNPYNRKGKVEFGKAGSPGQANRIYPLPLAHAVDNPGGPGQGRQPVEYDPVMDGEPGPQGAQGGHAGSIAILAGRVLPDEPFTVPENAFSAAVVLRLTANGGRGGDGQPGQTGAAGGRGGYGASYQARKGVANAGFTRPTNGGKGGDGGNGGKGGRGGTGGDSGQIVVRSGSTIDRMTFMCMAQNTPGSPGDPGSGGAPGQKGEGGDKGTGHHALHAVFALDVSVPDSERGPSGANGQEGSKGDPGASGTQHAQQIDFAVPAESLGQSLCGVVRVGQLQMMVERVRAAYLSLDISRVSPQAWAEIGDTLTWVRRMLIGFPERRPDGTSCQDEYEVAQRLKDVVNAMRVNHANNCDYFGKSTRFAPTLSLSTYDNALTKTLACLAVLETKRADVLQKLETNEIAVAQLEDGKKEANAVKAYLTERLADATAARRRLHKDLVESAQQLQVARAGVEGALRGLDDSVNASFGLSTQDVLNALGQVVFMGLPIERGDPARGPGGAAAEGALQLSPVHAVNSTIMAGVQIASVIDNGLKNVLNDSGDPVDKKYVVNQVRQSSKSLKESLSVWKADGFIVENADGIRQLACRRDELDDMLGEFGSLPGARVARGRFDDYVNQVEARGRVVATYNDQLMREYAILGELQKTDLQRHQIDTSLSRTQKPGLGGIGIWLSSLYELVKASCLDELYMAHRAEAFWAAKPYSSIQSLLPGRGIDVVDRDAIATAQTQVSTNILSHLKEALATRSRFPVAGGVNETGVVVVLTPETHSSLFDDLRTADVKARGDAGQRAPITVRFRLPVATAASDPINAFHGKADVRLTKVRPYLIGLKTTSHHQLTIIHGGEETIQSSDDESFVFEHDPRPIPFEYSPGSGGLAPPPHGPAQRWPGGAAPVAVLPDPEAFIAAVHIHSGGELELPQQAEDAVLRSARYAPIGPFAKWTIVIRYNDYTDLDLSALSAIAIDFHGFFRPFN